MFGRMCGMKRRINLTLGNAVLFLLTGMSIVGILAACLFVRAMLDHLGETAFPSVVAETFWICVWLVVTEAALIVIAAILFMVFGSQSKTESQKA